MKKTAVSIIALFALLLSACSAVAETEESNGPMGKVYYSYFDTVSYVYSYSGDSAERFDSLSADVSNILGEYHRLFDIYHEYEGVTNLCTLNKNAGKQPLPVDEKLISFLNTAMQYYEDTEGEMNVMLGSVLSLWHECREAGDRIPSEEELLEASQHTDVSSLVIDEKAGTVFISDPAASIDVGALGKGYATEMAAQYLEEQGAEGYVLNIGGNIRIIGDKPDGSPFRTAIKNPINPEGEFAALLEITGTSCVTSGVYERFFTFEGKRYHHIIDKDTLYPSDKFSSITVVVEDSAAADALSTALFCMTEEEGTAVAEKFGAEILWIYPDGTQSCTEGMKALMAAADSA